MNSELTSQIYMLLSLSQFGLNSSEQDKFSFLRTYLPIIIMIIPHINKLLNLIIEWIQQTINSDEIDKIVSIKFPVHEVKINNDNGTNVVTRQLHSINYLAINDYIRENLNKINGIGNLIEIINISTNYYLEDTNEKNFILIPLDSSEILIEQENKIYCKILSTEKKQDSGGDNDKKKSSNDNVKIYELILFCKSELNSKKISDEEKKNKMFILNNFIELCIKKYNDKNAKKYDDKHMIYEYYHSYKDEYCGLTLKFKEYLFENNKDLNTNIFFEGKEKLIKYVDKFIYNKEFIQNNIINKNELEYKSIGYTYKATFLLYGYPGCGKTSTIKAILNRTKRHGIIINWSKIKTCEELETIFRIRKINGREYDSRELCYIIEDCDASKNNILLSRKKEDYNIDSNSDNSFNSINNIKNTTLKNDYTDENYNDILIDNDDIDNQDNNLFEEKIKHIEKLNKKDKLDSIEKIFKKIVKTTSINFDESTYNNKVDTLNLYCLLNILDGIIELHGVMVIFTSNHPEKLDEAFLRPGRIDFKQEFKRANIETLISIVNSKFKFDINYKFPSKLFIDYVLSPAEIQSICFTHDNIEECIKELLNEQQKYLYRLNN